MKTLYDSKYQKIGEQHCSVRVIQKSTGIIVEFHDIYNIQGMGYAFYHKNGNHPPYPNHFWRFSAITYNVTEIEKWLSELIWNYTPDDLLEVTN
jgi:hypothetical protein